MCASLTAVRRCVADCQVNNDGGKTAAPLPWPKSSARWRPPVSRSSP